MKVKESFLLWTCITCQEGHLPMTIAGYSFFIFMAAERTFIAIKPDGVQRGLISEILGRFERKGFKLIALKQLTPSRELAEKHYGVQDLYLKNIPLVYSKQNFQASRWSNN